TRDGDWEVYSMRPDGTDARRLTHSPGRDAHPIYASGARIVFQSPRASVDPNEVDLYTMDANGAAQRRLLTAPGFDGVPVPSPDGRTLAFQRGVFDRGSNTYHWELHLTDSAGANDRQLTQNTWSSQVPSWMPNGAAIVFFANPEGREQLYSMELGSGTVRRLATSIGNDAAPSVSPDGRFVAFHSDRASGALDLWILEIATGAVSRLTNGLQVRSQASWSRDGTRILFSGSGSGVDEVYSINRDGSGLTRLTRGFEGTR
ncbi:MAG: TolB family protein, partial [Gemmatimonadaceae bacterium]